MSNRILLTAFRPFFGGDQNRSETVCRAVCGGGIADVALSVLPVEQQAEAELHCQLTLNPGGIIMTGEIGGPVSDLFPVWTDVRIERMAINPRQQLHAVGSLPWAARIESEFARYLATHLGGEGTSLSSSIGAFWCNRIYHRGLEWSAAHRGVPCVFLHLAAAGNLENQIKVVGRTIEVLRGCIA